MMGDNELDNRSVLKIVDYQPEHQSAFKTLNEEWISTYFKMEEADYKALDHPDDYIIKNGGEYSCSPL